MTEPTDTWAEAATVGVVEKRAVFAVSDLHLELGTGQRTQAAVGGPWADHPARLFEAWSATVPPDAVVLVPGDISWGKTRDQIECDLAALDMLPGRIKVLSPGNHDYAIWKTQASIDRSLAPFGTLRGVRSGRAIRIVEYALVVAAIRGTPLPGDRAMTACPNANVSTDASSTRWIERSWKRETSTEWAANSWS